MARLQQKAKKLHHFRGLQRIELAFSTWQANELTPWKTVKVRSNVIFLSNAQSQSPGRYHLGTAYNSSQEIKSPRTLPSKCRGTFKGQCSSRISSSSQLIVMLRCKTGCQIMAQFVVAALVVPQPGPSLAAANNDTTTSPTGVAMPWTLARRVTTPLRLFHSSGRFASRSARMDVPMSLGFD